ncbi:MAG: HU family DNA-binding protein [Puniceicoccales bacterium]|jgi:nucleoid DNA-binding protein|nr:HU family DNA-binding protein [Puniceicoccales bacterium]
MNKTDLATKVLELLGAEKPDTSKLDADRAVKAVLKALVEGIKTDAPVQLIGFGTFKVVERPARTGVNPATGKPQSYPAKKVVKFSPGTELKTEVANLGKKAAKPAAKSAAKAAPAPAKAAPAKPAAKPAAKAAPAPAKAAPAKPAAKPAAKKK